MSTAVVSIKPFQYPGAKRSDLLYWFRIAVSEVSIGGYDFGTLPDYTSSPVETPAKPHLFKRLYQKALDRATLSCRVAQDTLEKLKQVRNWQDEVRRLAYSFYDSFNRSEDAYAEAWAEYQAAQRQKETLTAEQVDRIYQAVSYRIDADPRLNQDKAFYLEKLTDEVSEFECDWTCEDFQEHVDSMVRSKDRIQAIIGNHPNTVFNIVLIRACKKVLDAWN